MEVRDTVQEAVINTIPNKKKCKTAKWLSEEGLQIAEKRREAKGKGEKERYIHLKQNSKEQQGEIKKPSSMINEKKQREKNRMGNSRDLFKKIRYQGKTSCKNGHNKGQKWYGPNRSRRY